MKPAKTLLFITASGCLACSWRNGELLHPALFQADENGRAAFAKHMRTNRMPIVILADLIEEDFRWETIPPLRRKERIALSRRKLEQNYRDTPLRHATYVRGDASCEDGILYSAITNPTHIDLWLEILLEQGSALADIHSVPLSCAPLVKHLPDSNLLLLSWEKHAGLRQTCFSSGRLIFSRLTPLDDYRSFRTVAEMESVRIHQYLNNLSLLPPDSPLCIYIICHATDRHDLEAQLCDSAYLNYRCLDLQELSRHAGCKTVLTHSDAAPLFMHLAATCNSHSPYAAAGHTRHLRLANLRRIASWTTAAAATASLLWSVASIATGISLRKESLTISLQTEQALQHIRTENGNPSDIPATASRVKAAVLMTRKLDRQFPPPQETLHELSLALEAFPDIRLNKLTWQAEPALETLLQKNREEMPEQVILLEADLSGFSGSRREMLAYAESFRQFLSQHGYAATATLLPFDASPQGSIIANEPGGARLHAPLTLRLSRKVAA